jgi:hypothetical protein
MRVSFRPRRLPNAELRRREYLTEAEMERMLTAAKTNRWGQGIETPPSLLTLQTWTESLGAGGV